MDALITITLEVVALPFRIRVGSRYRPQRPTGPLAPAGRRKLVELATEDGGLQARVAENLQVSRATVFQWVRRYRADGMAAWLTVRPNRTAYRHKRQSARSNAWSRCAPLKGGVQTGSANTCVLM